MTTSQYFSNAKRMNLCNASFAHIGHDQVHNDIRTQNNNHGGGAQHNYSGNGQFINHGQDQNVNTGSGSFSLNEHDVPPSIKNSYDQNPARTLGFGENQVYNRRVSENQSRRNPFHQFNPASRRTRTDMEILEWMRTIVGDEKRLNQLNALRETKAERALEDMQRASYSPECDPDLKRSMLDVMIRLSEASGRCIQSHYNPNVQKLGNGPISLKGVSFADVWKGATGENQQAVALKVVRPRWTSEVGEKLKKNMREIIKWRMLDHPNVVPFIGNFYFGTNPQNICLVTPWMENGNIVKYLQTNHIDSLERFSFAWDVASGLEYLHRSIITHGNLKGDNILVTSEDVACITEFGLVQMLDAGGTSGYMRPTPWYAREVLAEGSITQKSDIYAYGCVCHEIFVERTPFHNLSEDELYQAIVVQNQYPEYPQEVDGPMPWEIMERCWSMNPSSRPAASDVVKSLEVLLSLF